MKIHRPILLALAIPLVLGACSADRPRSVMAPETAAGDLGVEAQTVYSNSAWIGSAGGQVSVAGCSVMIPAGALSVPTMITITRNVDGSVELGPHGQNFAAAVQLLFVTPMMNSARKYVVQWYDPDGQSWTTIPSCQTGLGRAAALEHFSLYRIELVR